jgi:hypothetical protein
MAFVVCVNTNAQNNYGVWVSQKNDKDELKGTEEFFTYTFTEMSESMSENMTENSNRFVLCSNGSMYIQLSKNKSFASNFYVKDFRPYTDILVGLYSYNGTLIEKFTLSCRCDKLFGTAYINDSKYEIFNTLNGKGYVRFVGKNFDFIVNNFSNDVGKNVIRYCKENRNNSLLKTFGIKHKIIFNIN